MVTIIEEVFFSKVVDLAEARSATNWFCYYFGPQTTEIDKQEHEKLKVPAQYPIVFPFLSDTRNV